MKRFLKKCLISICIVLALSNFIIGIPIMPGATVYAADGDILESVLGGIVGVLTWVPRALTMMVSMGINTIASGLYKLGLVSGHSDEAREFFITPYHVLFNKMEIVNINFFNLNSGHGTADKFRLAVASWYYTMRLLAVMILLVILVYVGIRMALSTIAQEQAKFKKMLVDWVSAIALLFLLHYIIQFVFACNDALVSAMDSLAKEIGMDAFVSELISMAFGISTLNGVMGIAVYSMLVYLTLSFLILYMKRMIIIGFLVIIAPLITITYPIDKIGDNKAQALNNWLKEFAYNILIQPFHCILYLAFGKISLELLGTGSDSKNIATAILVILCIQFIKDGEKIIKKIFNFDTQSMSGGLAESAKMATAAMGVGVKAGQAAGKVVGKGVSKGVNALSKAPGKIGNAANKVADKMNARQEKQNKKLEAIRNKDEKDRTKSEQRKVNRADKKDAKAETKKGKMREKANKLEAKRNAKQEEKIDKQMRKMMSQEDYEKVKAGKATPDEAKEFKAAAVQALNEKKDKNKETRRKITGAVGKGASWAGQKLKMAANSDDTKKIIQGIVATSFGMIGLGDNATTAINTGQFGWGFADGVMSTSTKTAKNEVQEQVALQNNLGVDVDEKHLAMVKANGDGEKYENKEIAKKLQQLLDKLKELEIKNAQGAVEQLNYDISSNPQNVTTQNIEKILSDAGVSENNKDAAMEAMLGFAQFRADAGLYKAMENGHAVGMDMNDILKTAGRANTSDRAESNKYTSTTTTKETNTTETRVEEKETDSEEMRNIARSEAIGVVQEAEKNQPKALETEMWDYTEDGSMDW